MVNFFDWDNYRFFGKFSIAAYVFFYFLKEIYLGRVGKVKSGDMLRKDTGMGIVFTISTDNGLKWECLKRF